MPGRLPRGWHRMRSGSGKRYYYNRFTQAVQWRRPHASQIPDSPDSPTEVPNLSPEPFTQDDELLPMSIKTCQIIIKHRDCANPVDRHNDPVTRTVEEARQLAVEIRNNVYQQVMTFEECWEEHSDCLYFLPTPGQERISKLGELHPPVEQAAFSLQVGELSGIIKSCIGFHIILRRE